jgi:hypothetical protein
MPDKIPETLMQIIFPKSLAHGQPSLQRNRCLRVQFKLMGIRFAALA